MTTKKVPLVHVPEGRQTIAQMMKSLGVIAGYEHTSDGAIAFDRISLFELESLTSKMRGLLEFLSECEHLCDPLKHVFVPYKFRGVACVAKVHFSKGKHTLKVKTTWRVSDDTLYSVKNCQFLTGFSPREN
jgi:hypothetical protein